MLAAQVAIKLWPRGAECINVDVQRELHHHSGQVYRHSPCYHCVQGTKSSSMRGTFMTRQL